MAWIRVESSVSRNRKFVKAGPAASWLWLCGLAYCQEGLTDGFIPDEAVDYLGVQQARRLAGLLVKTKLWAVVEGGWEVHDYLDHNKPAAEVRRIQGERRSAGGHGGEASGEARRKQVATANAKQPANPSTSTATATATSTATSTGGLASPPARPTIHPKRNLRAAYEGSRGLHVPDQLHVQFVGLRNHPGAEDELLAWYRRVCAEWTTGARRDEEPGSEMFDFWRARYAEEWPPTAAQVVDTHVPEWLRQVEARKRAAR